jgi:hypothetical protein
MFWNLFHRNRGRVALTRSEFLAAGKTVLVPVGRWCTDPDAQVLIGTMGATDATSLAKLTAEGGLEVGKLDWIRAFCVRIILDPVTGRRMFGDGDGGELNKHPEMLMAIATAGLELDAAAKKNDSSGGPSPGVAAVPTPTNSPVI